MSGKKQWEVAAVLEQGESVRKLTDEIFSEEIRKTYKNYLSCLDDENAVKKSADGTTAQLDDAAEEMFGDKGKSALENFRKAKKSLSGQSVTDKGKNLLDDLSRLDRELAKADKTAQEIRDSIRYKQHYCTPEYNQAQALLGTYENLRSERVSLERRMKKLLTDERQNLSSMRSRLEQLKNLAAQIENMNVTAKKRKEADGFRNELRGALNSVDTTNAKKFFATEFDNLQKKISAALSLGDDEILSTFQQHYTAIADFKQKLSERVARWHKEKNDADELFAQMENAATENFIHPIDKYAHKKDGRQINLFDYVKTYGGEDFSADYRRQHDEAAELIRQEKFVESMTVINAALEVAEKTRQAALNLQESMLKKTGLAGAIQKVMHDFRYNIKLKTNNDNPNDGFRITCSVGDETIDFQHVDIDADGKVVVNLDHKEAAGTTCGATWNEITDALRAKGIPLTDVRMANGRSVLFAETTTTQPDGQVSTTH